MKLNKCLFKFTGQYLIALAKQATNSTDYIQKLKDTGTVEIDTSMVAFAKELWDRVPHKAVKEQSAIVDRRKAAEIHRQNQTYTLLSDSDDDDGEDEVPSKRSKTMPKNQRTFRKKAASESSSSEDETVIQKRAQQAASSSEDEIDKIERERLEDLKDRDEFAERLKKRDKDKTRNVNEKSDRKFIVFI